MQSRSQIGWNVAILAVLSISLTGCMGEADSGDYEVILDQPDESIAGVAADSSEAQPESIAPESVTSAQADSEKTSTTDVDASDATVGAGASKAELVDATTPVESGGDVSVETPVATPTPSEQTGNDDKQASTKPVVDSEPQAKTDSGSQTAEKPKQAKSRVVKLLIPDKKFKTVGPEKVLRVSFDDFDLLKVLNMDPVTEDAPSRMPKWLKDLDGKRIRLKGFMYPQFEETGIRGFVFARDNEICCFGRNPLVYDLVDVFLRKGETTDYIQNRPFDVVGVFHIGDSVAPGELYSMDDAVVIDR